MTHAVIRFSYPRRGLTGLFTTFRLGAKLSQTLAPGDQVDLVDARTEKLLGRAAVLAVYAGELQAMALSHAHLAHNWKEHPQAERSALLVASMKRRYPPGRVLDHSLVTVIYLQEQHEPEQTSFPD